MWLTQHYRGSTKGRRRKRPTNNHLWVEPLESRALMAVQLLNSFPGINFADDPRYRPPDTDIAAGPKQIMEVVNASMAIYDKGTGARLSLQKLEDFFAPIHPGSFVFDPVVTYDAKAHRFVVAALDLDNANQKSYIDLAVSNTSDPTDGFTEMHKIDVTETFGGQKYWGDYPKLGWNADAIVITVNMFGFAAGFNNVQVVSIDTSSVTDADNSTFTIYKSDRDGAAGNFTMAAATMHDAVPGGPMYFVEEAGFANGSRIRVVKMTNVLSSTPTFTDTNISVDPYAFPPGAPQKGGSPVQTNDTRILNAELRNGHLVATQTVGTVDSSGQIVAHARWYEFNTSGATPTLEQAGEIDPGPGIATYFPAIAISPSKSLVMTYMESSPNEYVSVYTTGRKQTDPDGVMQNPTLVKAGDATLVYNDRAGDYAGISADPVTDTLWAANEFAPRSANTDIWGTYIANLVPRGGKA